jgi:hypothetical protein
MQEGRILAGGQMWRAVKKARPEVGQNIIPGRLPFSQQLSSAWQAPVERFRYLKEEELTWMAFTLRRPRKTPMAKLC